MSSCLFPSLSLPVSFALLPLSLLVFALFPSFPFASIILPVTCCCVGHKTAFTNTQGECVSVRVNVRLLLLKRQADTERVSLWSGYLGQTSALRLGKRQIKYLCRAVGGLASDRKAAPRPATPAHPRQSQYLWTLKMNAPRIHLQEHSRRCDTSYDGGFALQCANFVALQRRASPENLRIRKSRKTFAGPRNPLRQRQCATVNAWMHGNH